MRTAITALLLFASSAAAAPAPEAPSSVELGVATNMPLMWVDGASVGVSGYVGFARRHAVRANVASHAASLGDGIGTLIGDLFFDGDGSDAYITGRTTDVGVSYVFCMDSLWRGPFIEVGAMRRTFDESVEDENASPNIRVKDGTGYAGRVQAGWSLLIGDHAFIAAAFGISGGRYVGREHSQADSFDSMSPTSDVSYNRFELAGEAYLRVGFHIGL